jgi:hypothetical protein
MIVRLLKGIGSITVTGCGLMMVLTAIGSSAAAVDVAPEIDAGSLGSAVTLLVGGAMMLTDRIRRK